MEDWTDIFAEELKDVEMPLPADDWDVVREKYVAKSRRKKFVAWLGAASAAAALVVFAVLFGGGADSPAGMTLTADNEVLERVAVPDTVEVRTETEEVPEQAVKPVPDKKVQVPQVKAVPDAVISETADILVAESDEEGAVNVVKDTSLVQDEVLLADSGPVQKETDDWDMGEWKEDDAPVRKPERKRISVGLSGSSVFGGGHMPGPMMDMAPDFPALDSPSDTSSFQPGGDASGDAEPQSLVRRSRSSRQLRSQDIEHYMPVSYGISARFPLTERLSLNTGLNYTLYTSKRLSTYSDGSVESEKQNAHYLGIPLRLDWMMVNRKHFGMYLGVGTQLDRCVYAKVGNERLYDSSFLWSLNGVLGMQYNITDRISLYFEPEITGNLGYPQIRTYRDDAEIMLTARFGLRFNL